MRGCWLNRSIRCTTRPSPWRRTHGEVLRIQFFREEKERFRIFLRMKDERESMEERFASRNTHFEKVQMKHRFRKGKIVFLQLRIKTGARRTEIGNAGAGRNASTGHDDDVRTVAHVFRCSGQIERLENGISCRFIGFRCRNQTVDAIGHCKREMTRTLGRRVFLRFCSRLAFSASSESDGGSSLGFASVEKRFRVGRTKAELTSHWINSKI